MIAWIAVCLLIWAGIDALSTGLVRMGVLIDE